ATDDKGAVEPAMGVLAGHRNACLMANGSPTEQESKAGKAGFPAQRRVELRQMQCLRRLFDDGGAGQLGAVSEPDGDDVVAPIAPFSRVDLEHAGAAAFAERNQAAGVERTG